MASSENTIRERDRIRRQMKTPEEREARLLNWAIASMCILKLCHIDWPDVENMTYIGMLL